MEKDLMDKDSSLGIEQSALSTITKKSNRGGARKGAGRKPASDLRKYVGLWLTQAEHEKLKKKGGTKAVREWLNKD